MSCAFCEQSRIADRTVLETDLVLAFPTRSPIVPGHMLIIPRRHVERLEDATAEEREAMERARIELKTALCAVFGAEGFNYAWNEGAVGGQSVPHVHLHVIPRKSGDAGIHGYEPRSFLYRPGVRATSPDDELRDVAALVRAAL